MRRLYPQSLRGRMILSFVLAGAVPLIACLALLDWRVSTGAGKVTNWTNQTLVQAVYRRLSAVRDIHSEALARDLEQSAQDIRTFAEDPAVVVAAKEFAAIESRPEEAQSLATTSSEVQRSEISKFYREQFGPAFIERKGMPCELHKAYAAGLDEMAMGLQYSYIAQNPNPLGSKHLLNSVPGEAAYHQLHGSFHPRASNILSLGGYYDVFVVTPQSRRVIYSVYKEIDFGVRLEGVLIGESGLARAVDAFLANPRPGRVHIEDFAPYRPSYDAPASFLSTGVFEGSQLVGVAVFQLPVDRFTALVASRAGLGESGETLVVGADYLPRTDSTIDPLQRSVAAAWANPDRARVDTPLIRAALEGKSGLDRGRSYHGGEVLAAYTPLRILGLNWALMVEQNFEEAMAERAEYSALAGEQEDERRFLKVVMALLGVGLVLIIGISIGTSISRPIQATKRTLSAFAKGDLGYSEPIETSGELLEMTQALDLARDNLRQTFGVVGSAVQELRRVTDGLGTLSYELLHRSQDGTQKVSRASASVGDVSAAMHALGSACHQMMASVREISVSSSQVARQAQDAAQEAEETGSAMARLTQSSNEIGEVTAVIRKIAEQTNLLALNATIEAARAAEAGKGFAVVATEVKELSNGTSKATKEIIHRIDSMQADTKLSYSAIESIAQTVARASEAQQSVATAVEEQSAVTSEIARNATHCLQDIETVVTELKNLHQSAELTVLSSEKAQATAVRVVALAQRVEELLAAYRLD